MTETLLKYFQLLKTEKLLSSQVPKALLENNDFQNMLDSGIIVKLSIGRGYVYELNEEKKQIFENWFAKKFPNADIQITDRASSIAKFKDSKKSKEKSVIVFLKGNKQIKINNETVDLQEYTQKFGFFACVLESLKTEKLCFVENKESFLQAEKVISQDYVFIHSYGRIGKNLLERIQTNEVLVFSDYDYIGLNEYLKCKSVFENTIFFVPENYDLLFEQYAKEITLNRKKGQKASKNVLASQDEIVVRICRDLQTKQKFLEQESLLISL
ncbi:MAG: hypothetical protein OHK0038_23540 [Flammeovirgaceae bacterium]